MACGKEFLPSYIQVAIDTEKPNPGWVMTACILGDVCTIRYCRTGFKDQIAYGHTGNCLCESPNIIVITDSWLGPVVHGYGVDRDRHRTQNFSNLVLVWGI